jgi:hypothetical protein
MSSQIHNYSSAAPPPHGETTHLQAFEVSLALLGQFSQSHAPDLQEQTSPHEQACFLSLAGQFAQSHLPVGHEHSVEHLPYQPPMPLICG